MQVVYLGLGSNMGDRADYLFRAISSLVRILAELRCSSVYETEPRDMVEQPKFLNMVASGTTELSPEQLLAELHSIESACGRDRLAELPKGPRTMDIDLLLYGDLVRRNSAPILPHPRMHERQFVLMPLCELEPELREPASGASYQSILDSLPDQGVYATPPARYNVWP